MQEILTNYKIQAPILKNVKQNLFYSLFDSNIKHFNQD